MRLLEQLREHYKGARGWQRAVANAFGVDSSLISLLVNGDRQAGPSFLDGSYRALGLSPTWYTDPAAEGGHFRAWLTDPDRALPALNSDADGAPSTMPIEYADGLTIVSEVAAELRLDYAAKGRLLDAASVVRRKGGLSRADVVDLARVLGLDRPPTAEPTHAEARERLAQDRERLKGQGLRTMPAKAGRRGK